MTKIGAFHFQCLSYAVEYFKPYGYDKTDVQQKIAAGEIHIGPPDIKPGERLSIIPGEGRYQIERD